MDLTNLRYFLAVAREGSMTHAASTLFISQPTLSKRMSALEAELGHKLFRRSGSALELTDAARLLRERAETLIAMADKTAAEVRAFDENLAGDLFFGLAESPHIRYVARWVSELQDAHPGVRFRLTSGDTEQVVDKLHAGLLDFAVLASRPDPQIYHTVALPEADVWGVVTPRGSELAGHESLSPRDLTGVPLICSEQAWDATIVPWAGDVELRLAGSTRLAYNGAQFVREGLGHMLTFADLVNLGEDLAFRPLVPRLETQLHLVWLRAGQLSPLAQRFAEKMEAR